MKQNKWKRGIIFLIVILITILFARIAGAETKSPLDSWIYKLGNCESQNNDKAYNPKDLDNTPSIGKYQFKITTFKWFIQKYNLYNYKEWEQSDYQNNIWDGIYQEKVLRRMIQDPTVKMGNQFPACVRKLGLPPKDTIATNAK